MKHSVGNIDLPVRLGKVIPETDVLVVGGGPAGIGAALGAADAGAKVVLAEQYGFLGGAMTAGLVLTLASYYTSENSPPERKSSKLTFFPEDHGPGKPIVGGVLGRLVDNLVKAGGAFEPSIERGFVVPFDPEILKFQALEMLDSAGVELLFHAFASGIINDNGIRGVVFETKGGPIVVKAKVIVDCTGDGDIAYFAGAPFEIGSKKSILQPMTLIFLVENYVLRQFGKYVQAHPDQWHGVQGLTDLMKQAKKNGKFDIPRENALLFGGVHEGQVLVNSTRILGLSSIDAWDLTQAEIEGRRQVAQLINFFRKFVPGFKNAYVQQSGLKACPRESRRIMGEYKLTAKDVLEGRKFSDAIALSSYPIDIHSPKGAGTIIKKIKPGAAYDIPLRCLIPLRVENLLVAGRCISGTHIANASCRVMPTCFATGQAAGVCAAISVKTNQPPRKVPATAVQKELIRQGAILKI